MLVSDRATGDTGTRRWSVAYSPLGCVALLAAAFATRLGVRIAFGQEYFWTNGYLFYYNIAVNVVDGKGFCLQNACARYPPVYPLFLTISVLTGRDYWFVVVPQALLGAATTWCAYLTGREMFDRRTGMLACAITALYPYYVMHDTALQETGMVTFCTAFAVWLLLRARRLNRYFDWFVAGIALGTIPLVRASVMPAIAVGLLWCVVWGASGGMSERLRKCSIIAVAAMLTIGPWLYQTYRVTGVPIVSSETGRALWIGNNPDTFSHYPATSIDRSTNVAFANLSAADRAELAGRAHDEIATSSWYAHRALEFMRANPGLVVKGAFRKVQAGFSWGLNPHRELLAEAAYSIGYAPIALLGILGMVLARKRPGTILIALLFLAFIVVTAIFWANTSHRSYLDVYWIVFAASVIERIWAHLRSFTDPPPIGQTPHLPDQETMLSSVARSNR